MITQSGGKRLTLHVIVCYHAEKKFYICLRTPQLSQKKYQAIIACIVRAFHAHCKYEVGNACTQNYTKMSKNKRGVQGGRRKYPSLNLSLSGLMCENHFKKTYNLTSSFLFIRCPVR